MIPKRFCQTLDDSIVGFFQDSCSTAVSSTEVADMQVASSGCVLASLGFTGDAVKGVLLVVAKAESLKASHPMTAMGAEVSTSDLNDWAGEIANQILGRFKNSLLKYKTNIRMSVPTVVRGTELHVASTQHSGRALRGVRSESGLLFGVALLVSFAPGFDAAAIDEAEPAASETAQEGDGFFF